MTNKFIVAAAAFLIAGCAGVPVSEIRQAQIIHSAQTTGSVGEAFVCLTNKLGDKRDDRQETAAMPGGDAEILFGAMQFGSYRYFYAISIDRNDKGARILARWNGVETMIISADEIRRVIDYCAATG